MKKTILILLIVLLLAVAAVNVVLADPPAQSGMIVARGQDIFFGHYIDPAKGLGATVGIDVREYCLGNFAPELVYVQDIDVPDDANRFLQIFTSESITVDIWPFTAFDCALFLTVDPVASGTAAIIGTDNDVEVYQNPDNVNWNAFGFTARGRLTADDGDSTFLNTVYRCVWDGHDGDSGTCIGVINLRD